jgi:hypothetical protein
LSFDDQPDDLTIIFVNDLLADIHYSVQTMRSVMGYISNIIAKFIDYDSFFRIALLFDYQSVLVAIDFFLIRFWRLEDYYAILESYVVILLAGDE